LNRWEAPHGELRAGSIVALLDRCRKSDEAAWVEFRPWFRRVATRVLGRFATLSPVEREEVEDFARVAVAMAISEGRINAKTDGEAMSYVRTVVTNAARDAWRRHRAEDPLPLLLRDNRPSAHERLDQTGRLECVEKVVASWTADNRFVFMMKLESVSTAAIKADLERLFGIFVTTQAVDVRYFRLRNALRRACLEGG
jgi:DNA-directed RNA polymerase specialized sigma24 family protein